MDRPEREWLDARSSPQLGKAPTNRQLEVFLAILRHGSMQAAADHLGIGISTAKTHVAMLMARLGAWNFAHLAALLWERYPDLRHLMVLPNGEQGQRPDSPPRRERRKGQRRAVLDDSS